MTDPARFHDFGPFRIDREERLLYRSGTLLPLPPKAIDLLLVLMEEPGRLRTKEELIARVWPDVVVDESNLSQNIFLLRKALGDEGGGWIATVPRRGYRFAGDAAPASPTVPHRPIRASIALAIVVAAAAAVVIWLVRSRVHDTAAVLHSIAVLPFQPVDGKQRDPVLDLGMADSLINRLSQLSEIAISPTHAVMPYLDGHADALSAGRQLGVDGVIEGNIQREGRRIRCTVRLLRVRDGSALWAGHYDEDAAGVFDLEERMADRVASALDLPLGTRRPSGRYTKDRQAYELYLQGRLSWEQFDREGLEASIRYYNAALQRDPRYALAYAGLAKTYSVMYLFGPLEPAEAARRTKEMALRALALDSQLAEAHGPLAATGVFQDWNWNLAEEEVQRALELDPRSDAHALRGYILEARGRPEESLAELRRELEIDPLWRVAQDDCVSALYVARHYDEAIAEGLQRLAVRPRSSYARYFIGRALLQKGLIAEAAAQQETNVSHFPDYAFSIGELAVIAARRGDRAGFLKRIAQIEALRPGDRLRNTDYALAMVYAELNDADGAFRALDASSRAHYPFLWEVRSDPAFDSIRGDPRYGQVLTRLNLGGSDRP